MTTPAPRSGDALDAAWQSALAAEHRAVFGYAVLGPRLSGSDRDLAQRCFDAHETIRDTTEVALAAAGVTPVASAADYPDVYPVTDAATARRRAVDLEDTAARAWRYCYATAASSASGRAASIRRAAQRHLTAAAVRAVRWRSLVDPGRASTPFPGIA